MKVQVIYSSLTGCTEKLAKAIYEAVPCENKTIHNLEQGQPELDGDILLLGYWVTRGGPCEQVQKFLESIHGKTVGVFCTLGYYADTAYAAGTVQKGVSLLKDTNAVLGSYVCNGAVASHLMKGQGKESGEIPTEQKQLRWEMVASHPTQAECALGAERFRERINLYVRAGELNIPFTSIV